MRKQLFSGLVLAVLAVSTVGLVVSSSDAQKNSVRGVLGATTSGVFTGNPACPTQNVFSVGILNNGSTPGATMVISDTNTTVNPLVFSAPVIYQINSVTFYLSNSASSTRYNIANGKKPVAPNNQWTAVIPLGVLSSFATSGASYLLQADVNYVDSTATTSQNCTIENHTPVQVYSGLSGFTLLTNIVPVQWVGPTNTNVTLLANAGVTNSTGINTDVSDDVLYTWTTTLGKITQYDRNAKFFSGPQAGTATITVTVHIGGFTKTTTLPVKIEAYPVTTSPTPTAPTTPVPSPTPVTAPNPNSPSGTPVPTPTPTIPANPKQTLNADLLLCLKAILGDARVNQIISTGPAMTFDEHDKAVKCFSQQQDIIPAVLAPITATKETITALPKDDKSTKIDDIKTVTNGDKSAITLDGIAAPNTTIYIYIFSEPLVLTTKTDKDGKWSYVLEDPLEPGKHEAYIAVNDGGATTVRSSAFAFAIDTGTKSDTNPLGLSSVIVNNTDPKSATLIYVSAALIIVFASGGFLLAILKRRKYGVIVTSTNSAPTPPGQINVQG